MSLRRPLLRALLAICVLTPPFGLHAQPSLLWEEWSLSDHVSAFDVSDDGRYVAVIENTSSGGKKVVIYDHSTDLVQKYDPGKYRDLEWVEFLSDRVVRFFSPLRLMEMNVETGEWTRYLENVHARDQCERVGFYRSGYLAENGLILFQNEECKPPLISVYERDDFTVVSSHVIPEGFHRAYLGRTRGELIYVNEDSIGISTDKLMIGPPGSFISNVFVLGHDVYMFVSSLDDSVQEIQKIDLDNGSVLATLIFQPDVSFAYVMEGFTADEVLVTFNDGTIIVDRESLKFKRPSPARIWKPIKQVGDSYFLVEGLQIVRKTDNPNDDGEVLFGQKAPITSLAQDHRGRLLLYDGTLSFMDPMVGSKPTGTITTANPTSNWVRHVIADPDADRLVVIGGSVVDFQEGAWYENQICRVDLSEYHMEDAVLGSTDLIRFGHGSEDFVLWSMYRRHSDHWPSGFAELIARPGLSAHCDVVGDGVSRRFQFSGPGDGELHVEEFHTERGAAAIITSDTSIISSTLLKLNDGVFIGSVKNGYRLFDANVGRFDTVDIGESISIHAVRVGHDQLLCTRSTDTSICVFDLNSRSFTWCTDMWTGSVEIVVDRNWQWFVTAYREGLVRAFALNPTSVNDVRRDRTQPFYPQPASDHITISDHTMREWTLCDLLGRPLTSGTSNHLSVSELPGGVYLLVIDRDGSASATTVVVQH